MSLWSRLGMLLCAFGLATSSADASLMFPTLVLSSPDDLSSLTVGQKVEIDVTLTGLNVGSNFIFVLNSEVLFPSTLFAPVADPGHISGLTPGSIFLSDPTLGALQRSNFDAASSLNPGGAVGNFSDSSPSIASAINANGLYYSFILEAKAPGSDFIAFNPDACTYAATGTGSNLEPIFLGGTLAFTITQAVPEPSSIALVGVGLAGLIGAGHLRRRGAA